MTHRICPWWIGYLLACPIRRYSQDPLKILAPHVREGMTVLEPGPGMGFFTLSLAKLVGPTGRVIAVDIQPRMIASLKRRAEKQNLIERIDARLTSAETMGISDLNRKIDFTLAFAMVHELPDAAKFFSEIAGASKRGAQLLLAEPRGHVKDQDFAAELTAATAAGFSLRERTQVPRSHAALLVRN